MLRQTHDEFDKYIVQFDKVVGVIYNKYVKTTPRKIDPKQLKKGHRYPQGSHSRCCGDSDGHHFGRHRRSVAWRK